MRQGSDELQYNRKDIDQSFHDFLENFNDATNSKSCDLKVFIQSKSKARIQEFIDNKNIKITGSDKKGFDKLLKEHGNLKNYTCAECTKIGDLIISLLVPKDMRLEHTDNSFDYLMKISKGSHFKHPSEVSILKTP